MIRRMFWFTTGVAAGLYGAFLGLRKVRSSADALKPVNVAKDAAERARTRVDRVSEAIRAGRDAMRARELQLRAESGTGTGDTEVVSVEPGRVVVLRPGHARPATVRRTSPRRA